MDGPAGIRIVSNMGARLVRLFCSPTAVPVPARGGVGSDFCLWSIWVLPELCWDRLALRGMPWRGAGGLRVNQMQSRLQAHFAALAAEHSLSAIQAKILIQLDPGGAVTMRALAGRLHYDPSNLTTVIDRLEELGAVERRPDVRDRRVKGIVLTGKGLRLRATFWQRLVKEAGPLGGLGMGELAQLRSLLQLALADSGQGSDRRRGPAG